MRRMHNYYGWETIEDWVKAQNYGLVRLQEIKIHENMQENDIYLKKLLEMAECDCFPMSVACIEKGEDYFLVLDSLLYRFFQFLNNNISIEGDEERQIFFEDLTGNKKSRILKAQIHSVWIAL